MPHASTTYMTIPTRRHASPPRGENDRRARTQRQRGRPRTRMLGCRISAAVSLQVPAYRPALLRDSCTHARARAHTHKHTHTHTQPRIRHTHTHTHPHTRAQSRTHPCRQTHTHTPWTLGACKFFGRPSSMSNVFHVTSVSCRCIRIPSMPFTSLGVPWPPTWSLTLDTHHGFTMAGESVLTLVRNSPGMYLLHAREP